jgi:hypothetical protein
VLQGGHEGQRHRFADLIARFRPGGSVGQLAEQHVGIRLEPERLAAAGGLGQRELRLARDLAAAGAQVVQALVGGDRMQPGAQRRAFLEPVKSAPGSHHRLLQHVLGVGGRAEDAVAVRLQLAPEFIGELGERVSVPGLGPGQQLPVHVNSVSHGASCQMFLVRTDSGRPGNWPARRRPVSGRPRVGPLRKRKQRQGEATWFIDRHQQTATQRAKRQPGQFPPGQFPPGQRRPGQPGNSGGCSGWPRWPRSS